MVLASIRITAFVVVSSIGYHLLSLKPGNIPVFNFSATELDRTWFGNLGPVCISVPFCLAVSSSASVCGLLSVRLITG
jgi:hypothetical protein